MIILFWKPHTHALKGSIGNWTIKKTSFKRVTPTVHRTCVSFHFLTICGFLIQTDSCQVVKCHRSASENVGYDKPLWWWWTSSSSICGIFQQWWDSTTRYLLPRLQPFNWCRHRSLSSFILYFIRLIGLGSESPRTHLSTCDDLDLTHLNVRRS